MNKYYWIAFALACVSFLLRSVGIVLIASIIIYLLSVKEYHKTLLLLGLFLPTWLFNQLIVGSGHYLRDFMAKNPYDLTAGQIGFADLITRITTNINIYISVLAKTLVPLSSNFNLSVIVGIVLLFIVMRGAK